MKRLAILVSGNGTNMENLLKKIQAGSLKLEAALVLSDNPQAGALEKAKRYGVPVAIVERAKFASKAAFEAAIYVYLEHYKIDLIALAGFMKILSKDFVERYKGRLINIHPSYLPAFPGGHSIRDAFEARAKETGVTVHFVTAEVDAGPIILQRKVPIDAADTLETLEAKVHALEYEIYPEALSLVASDKVSFK